MKHLDKQSLPLLTNLEQDKRENISPEPTPPYEPPRLLCQGCLGELIRGSSWKGVDASGQVDPDNYYPV